MEHATKARFFFSEPVHPDGIASRLAPYVLQSGRLRSLALLGMTLRVGRTRTTSFDRASLLDVRWRTVRVELLPR